MTTPRLVRGLVSLLAIGAGAVALAQPGEQEFEWIQDVVLRADAPAEVGGVGARRWVKPPRLAVTGGTKEQQKIVAEVVDYLNEALKQTPLKGIDLVAGDDPNPTVRVELVRRTQIPAAAARKGVPEADVKRMSRKKWNYCQYVQVNPANKWEIQNGFALLSSNPENLPNLRVQTLDALCNVLGFLNHSKRYEQSIFYRDGDKRSALTLMTPRDRKLIVWYYTHVPPGAETVEMTRLYEKHWPREK